MVSAGAARITPRVIIDSTVVTPSGQRISIPPSAIPSEAEMSLTLHADDGRYTHTWASVTDYLLTELLRPGDYTASVACGSASDEGFESPFFAGHARLHLAGGTETEVEINARLASALFHVTFDPHLNEAFQSVGAVLHSEGYSYVDYPSSEERSAFLHPGNVSVALQAATADGLGATIEVATIPQTLAQYIYEIELRDDGAAEPTVTAIVNGKECGTVHITRQLLEAPAPTIVASGFTSGQTITVAEGNTPAQPTVMAVSGSSAAKLTLSTIATSLQAKGWPTQIDLATASQSELERLTALGLQIERDTNGHITSLDFTKVIPQLRSSSGSSRFFLMATGANGKQSDAVELDVEVTPVEISVISVSDILIGANIGEVVLVSRSASLQDNLQILMADTNGAWQPCGIQSITERGENEYSVTFNAAPTDASSAKVRIIYCGERIAEVNLKRVAPEYTIDADPFAMTASLRIHAADSKLRELITDLIRIYVDGEQTLVADRFPAQGIVTIGNLQPDHKYTITSTLVATPTPSDMTPAIEIVTEKTLQVRNSTFEDHDDGIKYRKMPCGGRYSQSIADVFNCQNFTDFSFQQPRHWANTNAKTFCTDAKNHNTWYMQPSVMSELDNVEGYVAVKLQSVAWDTDGAPIADYRQNATQYIPYNPNVPHIKYRAAGKLFLGNYTFDPQTLTETYTEGISFSSRPVAINGMYHFSPCAADLTDRGMIVVEVIGEYEGMEIALASATGYLPPALSYTAFSIPLTYDSDSFGIKATKLKIMISSSVHTGSIEQESSTLVTAPDARAGHSLGGTLWMQNLSLSYK